MILWKKQVNTKCDLSSCLPFKLTLIESPSWLSTKPISFFKVTQIRLSLKYKHHSLWRKQWYCLLNFGFEKHFNSTKSLIRNNKTENNFRPKRTATEKFWPSPLTTLPKVVSRFLLALERGSKLNYVLW